VIALLVYVALDLSLPSMPGAFVFDPAHSVESASGSRARGPAEAVAAPRPADPIAAPVPSSVAVVRARAVRPIARPTWRRLVGLPRVALAPAPARASEDPH